MGTAGDVNLGIEVINTTIKARTVTITSHGTSGNEYGSVLDKFITDTEQELATIGAPGMTFCLVDAEGFTAVGTLGWADRDRRIPVDPSHLFQIGSISKSFAALCAYRLADEGKIDLDASLSRYLPDVPLPAEPILVQQILSHTSGLPRSAPVFPRVPDHRLWTGFTPGTNYSYSNTAYDLVGMLVERVSGKPYPLALRELVIKPLGMMRVKEVLQARDRDRYVVGYAPQDSSGSNMMDVSLSPSPWVNLDTAAGGIGATANDMTRYLQYLIRVGRGRGAPLFSDALAKRFSTVLEPATASGEGTGYASGLEIIDLDGHSSFQHQGGTWGFGSTITVDSVTGVGCFVSLNAQIAGYRPYNLSKYACGLLRQVREGGTSPSLKQAISLELVENAKDYAGTYIGPDQDHFQLLERLGHLYITADNYEGRLQSLGEHKFLSNHPRFGCHFFDFEHDDKVVSAVWFGAILYGRGSVVSQPAIPQELEALQGTYMGTDPLTGWWRTVVVQNSRLVMENVAFYRVKNTLARKDDYWYLEGSDNPGERIRFEAVVNDVPQRLNFSGRDLWRFNGI